MPVLVAGTVALDSIETPTAKRIDLLGGSASFAAIAASFSAPVHLCSIVGNDFPRQHLDLFKSKGINTDCLEIAEGKTFRWSGKYLDDMNHRETLEVSIDVLEKFQPMLDDAARKARVVLLANMSPQNQLSTLEQAHKDAYIIMDSMDLWINIARDPLLELMKKVDLFVINEDEAKLFAETTNLITAGHRLRAMGPRQVVVKKGEHGALLFGEGHFFNTTAYPLGELIDPTGAGDTFAGGIAGYLSGLKKNKAEYNFVDMSRAIVHGTVLASFTCEAFSADRLAGLTLEDIDHRRDEFRSFNAF